MTLVKPRALDIPPSRHGDAPEVSNQLELPFAAAALAIGLFWTIGAANYRHPQPSIFVLFVAGVLLGAALLLGYRFAPWAVLGYAASIGVADRFGRAAFNGSDVVGVTLEAIRLVARGVNPYAHTFVYSNPPGSPFPYLPGEIAWYGLVQRFTGQVVGTDKWAGIGVVLLLAALAVRGGPGRAALGAAIYATFEPAILRSLDGSNDTSLAFLIVLAVALLAASERFHVDLLFYASALVFGWALLFKAFAWLIFPFVVNYLRRRGSAWRPYCALSVGVAALVSLPFFVTAPRGFVRNLAAGLSFHHQPFGLNVWSVLGDVPGTHVGVQAAPGLVVAAVLAVTIVLLRFPAADLGRALLQGCAVVFTALVLARYATSSYYTFVGAVLAAALVLLPPGG